ncbi:MAG: hypothetical protein ABIE03_02935 [Patescibacteria group bacterium]|nr:hypothetical protein [Patescibacteria group bacterium]
MKKLSNNQLTKAKDFAFKNGRILDIELMNHYFNGDNSSNVLAELRKFQNPDGGFAYGLEPDLRTDVSSNIAMTYAFQYFQKLNSSTLPEFLYKAIEFFEENYSKEHQRWIPIPEETNDSPHAVWWTYDKEKYLQDSEWGNPTVEIIGYLLKYENNFDENELETLKQKALKRLSDAKEVEVHELMCYQRFVKSLDKKETDQVYDKICKLAVKQVEKDSTKWGGYVARPLNFVDSPKSPVYEVLGDEVDQELDYLIENFEPCGGWYPNWDWMMFEKEWQKVKPEVAGMITVKNLVTLRKFGRIG